MKLFEKKKHIPELNILVGDNGKLPTRNNAQDAGLDLYASQDTFIPYQETVKVPTDIKMALPTNTMGLICDRSSVGSNGIKVMGGVIDNTYRGEVMVVLTNITSKRDMHPNREKVGYIIRKGDKVAQLLVLPVVFPELKQIDILDITERNEKGWGSSGRWTKSTK